MTGLSDPATAPEARVARRPARAEVIGSLLRPPLLLEALAEIYPREHSMAYAEERAKDRSRLDEIAEKEIERVVARQVEAGLDVVTDGEFRRVLYTNSLQDAIEGLRPGPKRRTFRTASGEEVETAPIPRAEARLRKVGSPLAREAALLARADSTSLQGHASGRVMVPLTGKLRPRPDRSLLRVSRRADGRRARNPAGTDRRGHRRGCALHPARLPPLRQPPERGPPRGAAQLGCRPGHLPRARARRRPQGHRRLPF